MPLAAPYEQDITLCLASPAGKGGLSESALTEAFDTVAPGLGRMRREMEAGELPLLALPERQDDLAFVAQAAKRHGAAKRIVILGTGGSSLGGQALCKAFPPGPDGPSIAFLDDIDPDNAAFATRESVSLPPLYIVISKSGSTAETLAQLLALRPRLAEALGPSWADHVLVITEPGDRPLRRIATRDGIAVLDHETGVGGRYSVLSNVGLLPFRLAGGDPAAVRRGAAAVLKSLRSAEKPADCPAAEGAALNLACQRTMAVTETVFMPYSDRLDGLALWFRQLWAESLGKGGHGTTPIAARGTVDQHSQLQLWLDGPADKLFNIILAERAGTGPALDGDKDPDLAYLAGRTLGDLIDAEQRATVDTLAARGRPVRVFRLARIDAAAVGALMMHFMLETILTGYALGLDPFDQPAVEDGKVLARKYLSEG